MSATPTTRNTVRATAVAALATALAVVAGAAAPAQAVTSSSVAPPATSAQQYYDVPPSAPTSLSAVPFYEGKTYTLLSWSGANPGTSVGPLEYHWKIASADPSCSGPIENLSSYQAVTSRTDALVPIGNDSVYGCLYTVGVQTMGVGQYGTYLSSPWTYTSYRIQSTWTGSTITAVLAPSPPHSTAPPRSLALLPSLPCPVSGPIS